MADASTGAELYGVVINALAAKARGETWDQEALEEAAFAIAYANLLATGMTEEQLERLLVERDYITRIAFEDGDLTIDIVWDDPEPVPSDEGGEE